MKKLIAIFLCISLLGLAACSGGEGKDENPSEGTVSSPVASGKIDGIDFGLGADVSVVREHYYSLAVSDSSVDTGDDHNHENEEPQAYYNHTEKDGYSVIDISEARFYYVHGKEDKGIAAVATDSAAFGFTPGVTYKYEIEEATEAEGETLNAGEKELKFLAVRQEEVIVLRYEYENYQLDYYFYDNMLITTVLLDTTIW